MSDPERARPKAVIFGCSGPSLTPAERSFFSRADPLGFILFERNCRTPQQVTDLVRGLRAAVGREDAPVLIDQEGGRVVRLKPPAWRCVPPAAGLAAIYDRDNGAGMDAVRLNARLIAAELQPLGIDVNCAPVLDIPSPDSHPVIGDRALGTTPRAVTDLGRAVCDGLLTGGVLPVIKHLPGHGRAGADSHLDLPVVDAGLDELEAFDFQPFEELAAMPMGMTAHVVLAAVDDEQPCTTSPRVIEDIIRGVIGFDGLLISDDVAMGALAGGLDERCAAALAAGCDVALHCTGVLDEMAVIAGAVDPLSDAAMTRLDRARTMRPHPDSFDAADAEARLDAALV